VAVYPIDPIPSSISVAAMQDPMHQFETDQGYEVRRSKHSRALRQYQLEYLGLTTPQMRVLRDFLLQQRLGVLSFEWLHRTGGDRVNYSNTTPVVCTLQHSYVTNQWLWFNSATHAGINGFWTITRFDSTSFALNGSAAQGGTGSAIAVPYLPNATARFAQDVMEPAVKLIGPEAADVFTQGRGRFNMVVLIQEQF